MIPKEMAKDLYNKFYNTTVHSNSVEVRSNVAKQSALIAAKEIADECNKYFEAISQNRVNYWVAVKAEIERL